MKTHKIIQPTQEILDLHKKTVEEIAALLPNSEVEVVGSIAVPMIGRSDLDIMVVSKSIGEDSKVLEKAGYTQGPIQNGISQLKKSVGEIELTAQVMDATNMMVSIHRNLIRILRENEDVRKRYEAFKWTLDGLTEEEYDKRKSDWVRENIRMLLGK